MRSLLILLVLALPLSAAAEPEHWKLLYREGTLLVSRDDSGALPAFKAEGTVEANLFDLMAVLADIPRRKEWMKDLVESRIVDGAIETQVVIYEQYHLPWPCSNRDSVVESTIHQDLKKLEVAVDYHDVTSDKAPPRDGVTRMPSVRGTMLFRYLDKTHSYARVIIRLDVGGHLPQWAVNQFVKQAPVKTLSGLVREVRESQGRYADFIRTHVAEARAQAAIPFELDPRSLEPARP